MQLQKVQMCWYKISCLDKGKRYQTKAVHIYAQFGHTHYAVSQPSRFSKQIEIADGTCMEKSLCMQFTNTYSLTLVFS